MLRLLTVVCLICFGGLATTNACSKLNGLMVKLQWAEFKAYGRERIAVNLDIWKRIFHDAPDARALFTRVNGNNLYSPEFKAHANRVIDGVDMTISMLDDRTTLDALLAHLKEQHASLSVPAQYFTVLRQSVIDLASEEIGPCFDYAAWDDCLTLISAGIGG